MSNVPVVKFTEEDGRVLRARIEREWQRKWRARAVPMTMRDGVPDACLFRGRGTLANHRRPVVERRLVFTDLGRHDFGWSPLVAVPCVVTTWKGAV